MCYGLPDRAPAENLGRTCVRRASCRSSSVARQGSYSVTMQRENYVDVSRLAAQVSLGARGRLWAVQDIRVMQDRIDGARDEVLDLASKR
eukprot:scaffold9703_cov67-Phaeocystis_antarctica.AAC.5